MTASEDGRLCKDAAYAMLSRVALYEGIWQKFHDGNGSNTSRSTSLLTIAKNAAKQVIDDNHYSIFYNAGLVNPGINNNNQSYRYMFILEDAAQCNPAGLQKSANTEYILSKRHRATDRFPSNATHGMLANVCYITRKMANMYLCSDGLPVDKSPLFKGYTGATDEFQNRDIRMDNTMLWHGESYWNNDSSPKHYWSNWDLVNLCSYLQIGILTENDDIVKFVVNYFTSSGDGNGALNNLVMANHSFTNPDGVVETVAQAQESGRDQGHASMAMAVAAQLAQAAWALYQSNPSHSSLDFFSANDNALLHLAEYTGIVNLKSESHDDITIVDGSGMQGGNYLYSISQIPFTTVGPWCSGKNHEASNQHTTIGEKDRGCIRPNWEILYSHYKDVSGSYFTRKFAELLRPEGGAGDPRYGVNSRAFDQIGWGTLMLYR